MPYIGSKDRQKWGCNPSQACWLNEFIGCTHNMVGMELLMGKGVTIPPHQEWQPHGNGVMEPHFQLTFSYCMYFLKRSVSKIRQYPFSTFLCFVRSWRMVMDFMPSPNIANAAVDYKHHKYLLQNLVGKIVYGSRNVFTVRWGFPITCLIAGTRIK